MKLGIDLKVDYAFKWCFGSPKRVGNLKSLLEQTLKERLRGPITELTILNPIQDKDSTDGKLSVLDILARDQSGTFYHIEMQLVNYSDLPNRFLYYAARAYSSQLNESQHYSNLGSVISIIFLDDVMFKELPGYHHCFQMREATEGKVFCNGMEIHLVEMPKFVKTLDDLEDGFDQWLYLFCHSKDLDPNVPPKQFTLPEVVRTLQELKMLTQTEQEKWLYFSREKAQRDELWHRQMAERDAEAALKKGLQEGIEKGLQEGIERGLQEGRAQEHQAMLSKIRICDQINSRQVQKGQPITATAELLELPEEELVAKLSNLT